MCFISITLCEGEAKEWVNIPFEKLCNVSIERNKESIFIGPNVFDHILFQLYMFKPSFFFFCHKELYLPRDLVLFLALIILKSLSSAFHKNYRLFPCIENWDDSILHFVSSQFTVRTENMVRSMFSSKKEIVVAQMGFSLGHQLTKK